MQERTEKTISRREALGRIGEAAKISRDQGVTVNLDQLRHLPSGPLTESQVAQLVAKYSHSNLSAEKTPSNNIMASLRAGPSVLIGERVIQDLEVITRNPKIARMPIKNWFLNPGAIIRDLKTAAASANAQAELRRIIGETTAFVAKVAGDDTKRDAMISYIGSLENSIGVVYLEKYCQENELMIPEPNTIARMTLLLRINAEMMTLQEESRAIVNSGREFVQKQVKIQERTAEARMLARELPSLVAAEKDVNITKEVLTAERARSTMSKITSALFGVVNGATSGAINGFESMIGAISTIVKDHPKVAIPLSAGVIAFVAQLSASGKLAELSTIGLRTYGINSLWVIVVSAVGTGIADGLIRKLHKNH